MVTRSTVTEPSAIVLDAEEVNTVGGGVDWMATEVVTSPPPAVLDVQGA
jgi:hypothetical protein